MKIDKRSALIVVDVQNDFCPGGALPVPNGDEIVPVLNRYIVAFRKAGAPIFFTRDWHPRNHISFKEQGGIWPPHCVQSTKGAAFHPGLKVPQDATVISKAYQPNKDAYSGFQGTNLAKRLRVQRVRRLFVGGLAADYCVKSTVLNGLRAGFRTYYLEDASLGVEVKPGDSERAITEMLSKGARKLTIDVVSVPQPRRRTVRKAKIRKKQ